MVMKVSLDQPLGGDSPPHGGPAPGADRFGAEGGPARRRGRAGFTLVELLIVIGIMSLLATMLLPVLGRARQKAVSVSCASNLHQIDVAMNMYLNSYNDVYPCAEDPVSTSPSYWLWMGRGWRGFIELFLGTKVDKGNPSVLVCPGDPAGRDRYESTSYAYSMCFYHSPEQIDAMTSPADTYSNPQPSVAQRVREVTHPGEKIIVGEWTSNHPRIRNDKGWWCWDGARNFLFADGRIHYVQAKQINPARDGLPDANLTVGGIQGKDRRP